MFVDILRIMEIFFLTVAFQLRIVDNNEPSNFLGLSKLFLQPIWKKSCAVVLNFVLSATNKLIDQTNFMSLGILPSP